MQKILGKLFVISGPSGVGKGTIIHKLLERNPNIKLSISATTRAPRPHEIDGVDYYFVSKDKFTKLIQEDKLAEWAEFSGNYYGTYYETISNVLENGQDLILEIEVKGAIQIKNKIPSAILIFILPPSFEELQKRLTERNTENIEEIKQRLTIFEDEYAKSFQFNYKITNDNLNNTIEELQKIIFQEKQK